MSGLKSTSSSVSLNTMAPIATIISGITYSAGSYTIPDSALNTALLKGYTGDGSLERLIYALIQIVYEKNQAGSLSAYQAAVEVSNKVTQSSVWEKTQNVFTNATLVSMLVSFCTATSGTGAAVSESATGVSTIP
jgi:hypothetical protein